MYAPTTILLAEDDRFLANMYKQKLHLEGFRVIHASDGQQAIEYLSVEPIAAALLDIIMPKANGFEVLEAIRQSADRAISGMPVVIVSNLSQEEHLSKSMISGANDYLVKPGSTPGEVVRAVKQLLGITHV
jgi:DNA-binding response OmpR family regulator